MPIHRTSLIPFVTILSACSLILAGPGAAEESATHPARKYELVCKYPPGRYVVQHSTTTRGEGFSSVVLKQTRGLTITPADNKGTRRVTLQIERLQTFMPPRLVWDSDNPPAKPEAGSFPHYYRPLLKVPLTAVVDAKGEWRDTPRIPDDVWKELTEIMPLVKKIPQETLLKEQFFALINDQQRILPPGPVAVGEKWEGKESVTWPPFGQVLLTMKCRLAAVDGPVAVIEVAYRQVASGKVGATGKASPPDLPDLELTSTVRFNLERGLMESRLSDSHFTRESDGQRRREYSFIEETISPRPTPATAKAQ